MLTILVERTHGISDKGEVLRHLQTQAECADNLIDLYPDRNR